MPINLLIVDDEITVRKRIIKRIDWNSLCIQDIREADDGMAALELCKDWIPDILLSDVRMPRMDGIELAYKLRQINPDLKIIFISGYADKEYLLSAIQLQATNYVEKPLNLNQLYQNIKNLCETIRKARQETSNLHDAATHANFALRHKLAEYLTSYTCEEAALQSQCQAAFGHDFIWRSSVCINVNFFDYHTDPLILDQIIENLYALYSNDELQLCATIHYTSLLIFLFSSDRNRSIEYQLSSSICPELSRLFQLNIRQYSIGIGKVIRKNIGELKECYQSSIIASQQCYFYENGYINYIHNQDGKQFDEKKIKPEELISSLKSASEEQYKFFIRNLFSEIRSYDNTIPDIIREYLTSFAYALQETANKEGIELWPDQIKSSQLYDIIKAMPFLNDVQEFILQGIHQLYEQNRAENYDHPTVNSIVQLIRKQYSNPNLSVDFISEKLNLSPSYISHLFKDITGLTIHNYIYEYRMEKAMQLAKRPQIHVSDIANMVGYRNGNYFSYLFKKKYGVSPTNCREYDE